LGIDLAKQVAHDIKAQNWFYNICDSEVTVHFLFDEILGIANC